MPGPGSGYLPPILATIEASAADLVRVLAQAKAMTTEFSQTPTTKEIRGDAAPLDRDLAKARATADAAAAKPVTFTLRLDIAPAMAALAEWNTYSRISTQLGARKAMEAWTAASAASVLGAAEANAAVAAAAAGAAAGGRRGGGGLLRNIFWGRSGGVFGFGAGLAGLGTVGSLAGFGPEHVLMTLLGLGGSAAGAVGGAGLLGLGSLGKIGVGGGSDLAVALEGRQALKALQAGILQSGAAPTAATLATSQKAAQSAAASVTSAQNSVTSATNSLKSAQLSAQAAQLSYNNTVRTSGQNSSQAALASIRLQQAQDSLAQAQARLTQANANLAAAQSTASQAQQTYNANLKAAASPTAQQISALAALKAGTLSQAQATTLYGQAAATAQYNVAQLAITTDLQWLRSIGGALVQFSALKTQLLGLEQTYIPLVADSAQRNLGIINTFLRPLFAWLEGPQGMQVFHQLENAFAAELPGAMNAFGQGVELLLKVMAYASQYTGGFITSLDHWLTVMNDPENFGKVTHVVDTLIGDFHLWGDLIKNLTRDIYDLFSQDAGTAQSVVQWLDAMLIKLGDWERSTQGKAQIHSVFEVHKQEILALLQLIPPLVEGLGKIYLTVAPPLTKALTTVLQAVLPLLDAMVKVPFGAWVIGLGLIAGQMGLLRKALGPVVALVAGLVANWAKIGWNALVGAVLGDSALGRKLTIGPGSAGPDTVFAGAVNEFAAAVTRFAAGSAAGAVGGAGGGAAAGEAEAAATGAAAATGLRRAFAVAGSVASKAFFAAAVLSLTDQAAQLVTGGRAASLTNADSYGNVGHAFTGDTGMDALQNLFTEAAHEGTTLGFGHTDMGAATRKLQDAILGPNLDQRVLDAIRSGNADELGKLAERLRQYGFGAKIVDQYHKIAQAVADDAKKARGKLSAPAQVIEDALFDVKTNIVDQVSHLVGSEMADMLDMEHRIALIKAAAQAMEKQTTGALGAVLNAGVGSVTFVGPAGKGATSHAAGGTIAPGTWGTVGERAMELAYAMPGGGVRILPLDGRGNGTGLPLAPLLSPSGGGSDPALAAALRDMSQRLASIERRLNEIVRSNAAIERSNASIDRGSAEQVDVLHQMADRGARTGAAFRLQPH